LNTSAFGGGALSLREELVHELIHGAGIRGRDPGLIRSLFGQDDLSWYSHYNEILKACK